MNTINNFKCGKLIAKTLFALAGMLFIASVAQATVSPDVEEFIRQNDLDAALSLASKQLKANPADQDLWIQKGAVLIQAQNHPASIAFFKKYSKKFSKDPVPKLDLAHVYRMAGNYKKSIETLRAAIKKFPEFGPAYEALGDVFSTLALQAYTASANNTKNNQWVLAKRQMLLDIDNHALDSYIAKFNAEADRRNAKPLSQQITNTMHSWVKSWNNRDIRTYLTHYAKDFTPANGRSSEQWLDRTRKSFEQSEYIKVLMDTLEMKKIDDYTVSVRFRELYESNLFEAISNKEIILQRKLNSWLIKEEKVVNG